MALTESKKRDFVKQLIVLIDKKSSVLTETGFDPQNLITALKNEADLADQAEGKQREAQAAAKDATALAQDALDKAYRHASDSVELLTGLLGKNNALIEEIRKMRK